MGDEARREWRGRRYNHAPATPGDQGERTTYSWLITRMWVRLTWPPSRPEFRIPFFFGASQRTVPTAFLRAALRLGERFVPIDIEGRGKNALDFYIAFYLGEYLTTSPKARCVILSNDKGFDPLIKHLEGRGFAVRRATSVKEAFASVGQSTEAAGSQRPGPCSRLQFNCCRPCRGTSDPGSARLWWHTCTRTSRRRCRNQPFRNSLTLIAAKYLAEVDGAIKYQL